MGGDEATLGKAEATSALRWWLESGVDSFVQEQPRNWLAPEQPAPPTVGEQPSRVPLPDNLEAFRGWLTSAPEAPFGSVQSKAILPQGAEGAEVMLLAEMPGRDEAAAGRPIAGEAWELMQRMLAAIGFTPEQAYSANLACFYAPGTKLAPQQLAECADAARRHVALAKPKRLLLLGDAPSRALLDKPLLEARGHVHAVEGVRTVVTFHPRFLLTRPSEKARAWSDLLLLMEENP